MLRPDTWIFDISYTFFEKVSKKLQKQKFISVLHLAQIRPHKAIDIHFLRRHSRLTYPSLFTPHKTPGKPSLVASLTNNINRLYDLCS
jgi:hypothetical protein